MSRLTAFDDINVVSTQTTPPGRLLPLNPSHLPPRPRCRLSPQPFWLKRDVICTEAIWNDLAQSDKQLFEDVAIRKLRFYGDTQYDTRLHLWK